MSARGALIGAAVGLFAAAGCKSDGSAAPSEPPPPVPAEAAPPARPPGRVRIEPAPPNGAVDAVVRASMASAAAQGRTLLVYVGARWCEPCRRFHEAAESGALDGEFPSLTLLEHDLDRDGERLAAAGYVSTYIPLFAVPAPDGRASGRQIEGSIKGDQAVANITPRLQQLLGR